MRFSYFAAAAIVVASGSAVCSADIIQIPLAASIGVSKSTSVTVSGVNDPTGPTSPVRGFYVSGTYSDTGVGANAGNTIASNLLFTLSSSASGFVTTTGRQMTGSNSSGPFALPNFASAWQGSGTSATALPNTFSNTLSGIGGDLRRANRVPANSTFDVGVSLAAATFDGGDPTNTTAQLTGATLNLMTDVIAPVSGTFSGASSPVTLTARPNSFTGFAAGAATGVTTTTGTFRGFTYTFTPATTGSYMIGADYVNPSSTLWDGFLAVYGGAFSASTPTANLVATDSDELGDANGTSGSALFIKLNAGTTYTVLITSQASLSSNFNSFTSYIAGIPTPGAAGLLGLGAIAAFRRRR